MGIGNIISDFNGILDSVTDAFGGTKPRVYPQTIAGIGDLSSITNLAKFDDRNWQKSRGYAFQVYRVSPEGALSPATGWQEFRLQINPQELTQDEIFAIEVTPTLRGVIVEHHGAILKDIVISGTTGISPLRKEGGAAASTGKPILQSGRSGYEEFHELRTYFRAYVESKRVDKKDQKGELRMVFKNFKDYEYIFVEPQKFTMKRSSSRPFMYDYNIVLKGIGHTALTLDPPSYFDRLDDILQTIQDYFDLAERIINGGIGIIRRFESDVVNTLLNPLRSINRAIIAIRGGRAVLLGDFGITRRTIDSFKKEIERIEGNFNDAIGRDTTKFNEASGRVPTLSYGSATRQTTYKEFQILNALGAAKKGVTLIAAIQDKIISKDIFKTNKDVLAKTNNVYSFSTPNSVKPVTILADDTIQTIAARELGDVDLFKDIVVLNNLKPPYISSTPAPGALSPGRIILIPQATPIVSNGVVTNKEYNITAQIAEVEKVFGVDIRIDENGDFVTSNTKDLDLVAGRVNLGQAIALRIYLEKGSLKRHQAVGTNLRIGAKAGAQDVRAIRDEIVTSLSSDSRIESIPFIEVIQEGNTTFINLVVKPKQSEQPIPIPIKLNNV